MNVPVHHLSEDLRLADTSIPNSRARRMHAVMLFHAAGARPREKTIASPAQLCEFLCDLRHWCDRHMVDLHKSLDQSYVRYMHDKHQALTSCVR